jgi:hypothetical protein
MISRYRSPNYLAICERLTFFSPGALRVVHKIALRVPGASPLRLYIVPESCFEEVKSEKKREKILNTGKVLLASKCVSRVFLMGN